MRIGFTGPKDPMGQIGDRIYDALALLNPKEDELVVGGCIGVDALVARIGINLGFKVHCVLPANRSLVDVLWREYCTSFEEMPPGTTYMDRNDRLVALADRYIGFPNSSVEELRSGTWATLRRARKKGIPVKVIING